MELPTSSRPSPRSWRRHASRLVAIALDDILGEREQINIPGTVDEHPNWRRKLPVALEDLEGYEPFRRVADVSREIRPQLAVTRSLWRCRTLPFVRDERLRVIAAQHLAPLIPA